MLKSLNCRRIADSLTSLVESTNKKKNKVKCRKPTGDEDYIPTSNDEEEDDISEEQNEVVSTPSNLKRAKYCSAKEGRESGQLVPPMSVAKFLKMDKKQQQLMLGEEALKSFSSAMKVLEQALSSETHLNNVQQTADYQDDVATNEEQHDENYEGDQELCGDTHGTSQEDISSHHSMELDDLDEQIGNEFSGLHEDSNGHPDKIMTHGAIENQPDASSRVKKTSKRGLVYCRKLTNLPPGEKLYVEFDPDGNTVGKNSSIFAFFLGEQVRNRTVCPVQVKLWGDYKPETIDHLWECVLEKFTFDNPEERKDDVMTHAQALFRDSRHKLKSKYFDDPKLQTKEARLKNKPFDMLRADWKFLVDHWSDPKFQAKSMKAKRSRARQKMPHYTGTKSYARVKHDFREDNGRECSRVDLLMETRRRKSKKPVNSATLATNMQAVDEMKKLKEQRDQGLCEKTDEQIFVDVLGKDTNGYLRAYGRGKSITDHYGVKPSRLNLALEVQEVKKTAQDAVQEARKDVEEARKDAEEARKDVDEARRDADEARKDAESAKREAEATRSEIDQKIAANNKLWEEKLMKILEFHGVRAADS